MAKVHLMFSSYCLLVVVCQTWATPKDVVLLTGGDTSGENSVEIFGHPGCSSSLSLPDDRMFHTSHYIDGKVIICGGNDPDSTMISCLQLLDGQFVAHSQLNEGRMHTSGVVLDGKLHLMGGFGTRAARSMETLIGTTWTRKGIDIGIKSSCVVALDSSRALVMGGLLYGCVGSKGWDGDAVTLYDANDGTWEKKKSLPGWRQGHGCATLSGGGVLVAGGWDQNGGNWPNVLDTAAVYNGDSWEELAGRLNTGRRYGQMVELDGRILYFGGEDNEDKVLDTVEEFDEETGTWKLLEETMQVPRKGFSAVVVPATIAGCNP